MIDILLVATSAIMKKCQLVNFRERFANLELCIYACKHVSKNYYAETLNSVNMNTFLKITDAETYTKHIMQMFTQ